MQVNAFKGIALAAINLLNMGQSIEDVRKATRRPRRRGKSAKP